MKQARGFVCESPHGVHGPPFFLMFKDSAIGYYSTYLKVPEKAPGRKVCACYMNGKTTILNRHCLLASLLRLIKYRRQFKKAGWWMKWNCRFSLRRFSCCAIGNLFKKIKSSFRWILLGHTSLRAVCPIGSDLIQFSHFVTKIVGHLGVEPRTKGL